MPENGCDVVRIVKDEEKFAVLVQGPFNEVMSALSAATASVFCTCSPKFQQGDYSEADLYEFLEVYCKQIKELVEMRAENGD